VEKDQRNRGGVEGKKEKKRKMKKAPNNPIRSCNVHRLNSRQSLQPLS
jgi:hypothetical protein